MVRVGRTVRVFSPLLLLLWWPSLECLPLSLLYSPSPLWSCADGSLPGWETVTEIKVFMVMCAHTHICVHEHVYNNKASME